MERDGDKLAMDFPSQPPERVNDPVLLGKVSEAVGKTPSELLVGPYLMAVFDHHSQVTGMQPDFGKVAGLGAFALIVTAPGDGVDFVSRMFAPNGGLDEDPVTGSAHCILTPYWSERLSQNPLVARQVSKRGGTLWCSVEGPRVRIAGHSVEFMRGRIAV